MFAKLVAIILSIGLVACVLLTVRQQRLRAVSEMAQISRRVAEHDRTLWKLRVEIAARVTPEKVQRMAVRLGTLVPVARPRWIGGPGPADRATASTAGVPDDVPLPTPASPPAHVQPVSLPARDQDHPP